MSAIKFMKGKGLFLSLLFLLVSTLAWGQAFDPWSYENQEGEIQTIDQNWLKTPLKVGNDYPNAMNRNFAKAFCGQYPKYAPNVAMMLYLKNPDKHDMQKEHFFVEDSPRNGYIKCDMMGQFDFMTEVCFWKRANGHSLVGVLTQMGHEGEGTKTDYAMLFYDYNPSTRMMTPDMTIYQTVKDIVAKHHGCASFTLPEEGKDIKVNYVDHIQAEDADFHWENCTLKWANNTFKETVDESGTF